MQDLRRKPLLSAGGFLLAVALAVAGQALFNPRSGIALSQDAAWLLATAVTAAAMGLAAWLTPDRSDSPGLLPAAPAAAPPPRTAAQAQVSDKLPAAPTAARHLRLSVAQLLCMAGVGLSLTLVYVAQLVFLDKVTLNLPAERVLAAGSGLLALGMILFAVLTRHVAIEAAMPDRAQEDTPAQAPDRARTWSAAWWMVTLAAYGYALVQFDRAGENWAVRLAWLLGIVALVLAQWPFRRIRVVLNFPPRDLAHLLLAGILIAALAMRTYRLTAIPYNLDGDFASHGLQARLLATGQETQIFRFGWADIPMLGFMPSALTMLVFGAGPVGLNMAAVIEGTLTVLGVYLLGRSLFSTRVGLLAAALLAISYTHLHFSRTSEYIDPVFFLVYAVYFAVLGVQRERGWAFVLSGLFSMLAFQMYYSGRIVVFVVGFVVLYLLLARRRWLRVHWRLPALWAVGFAVALGPYLIAYLDNWDSFISRGRDVFLFHPPALAHMYNKYQVDTVPALLWEQLKRTLLLFYYYGDTSTQFGFRHPFLDPFTAPIFGLGVAYSLVHWKRFGHALMLAWLGLTLVMGCTLTTNAPFWPRLLGLLPPAAILAAVALEGLYAPLDRRLAAWGSGAARAVPALVLALAIVYVGLFNWNWYLESEATWAATRTRVARYVADEDALARAYVVQDPFSYTDREFEFLAPGRFVGNLSAKQARGGQFRLVGEPTLVVLTPNHVSLLEPLQARFPDSQVQAHPDNAPGSIGFYVVAVPRR